MTDETRLALCQKLGLAEDATEEQILAAVAEQGTRLEEASALAASRIAGPPAPAGETTANLSEIGVVLGLPVTASETDVLAALGRAREALDRYEVLDDEMESLRARAAAAGRLEERVKVIEAQARADRVKRILDDGVRAGKVLPTEKVVLARQFATNPQALIDLLETRPEHMFRFAEIGVGGDGSAVFADVTRVADEFKSELGEIDVESGRVHARAMQVLADQGIRKPTDDQYAEALAVVAVE